MNPRTSQEVFSAKTTKESINRITAPKVVISLLLMEDQEGVGVNGQSKEMYREELTDLFQNKECTLLLHRPITMNGSSLKALTAVTPSEIRSPNKQYLLQSTSRM